MSQFKSHVLFEVDILFLAESTDHEKSVCITLMKRHHSLHCAIAAIFTLSHMKDRTMALTGIQPVHPSIHPQYTPPVYTPSTNPHYTPQYTPRVHTPNPHPQYPNIHKLSLPSHICSAIIQFAWLCFICKMQNWRKTRVLLIHHHHHQQCNHHTSPFLLLTTPEEYIYIDR